MTREENNDEVCYICSCTEKECREAVEEAIKALRLVDIDNQKYLICCPLCDNEKCVRNTDKCEAEQWKKRKLKEMESEV